MTISISLPAAAWANGRCEEVAVNLSFVSRDPDIMSGAFCFTGTRVPVKQLFEYVEGGSSLKKFLEDFPSVQREAAVAVLEAVADVAGAPAWGWAPQRDRIAEMNAHVDWFKGGAP